MGVGIRKSEAIMATAAGQGEGMDSGMARRGPERALGARQITVPYPRASGNQKTRLGASGVYSTAEARAYDLAVKQVVVSSRWNGHPLDAHIEVHFDVWPPDKKNRDSDNVEKVLKDALTKAGFWTDDSNRIIRRSVFTWHDVDKEEAPEGAVVVSVFLMGKSQ